MYELRNVKHYKIIIKKDDCLSQSSFFFSSFLDTKINIIIINTKKMVTFSQSSFYIEKNIKYDIIYTINLGGGVMLKKNSIICIIIHTADSGCFYSTV